MSERTAANLVKDIAEATAPRGLVVVTAESCTGGLVSGALTDRPGSSAYYLGGIVAYANAIKTLALGVDAQLIERHGAVSAEVAQAMAHGVLDRLGGHVAVSLTGIAGPDGGSASKPVGTVWLGLSYRYPADSQPHSRSKLLQLGSRRSEIRDNAVQAALEVCLEAIQRINNMQE